MHFFRRGGADALGTVAFWSPWHFCSPLRYRNSHLQFLQIRDSFFMGLMGLDGETKWQKLKKLP